MSGEAPREIELVGQAMTALVGAIPRVQQVLQDPVIIGGLAVMCRLSSPHRVTEDLDALRRHHGGPTGLQLLMSAGAEPVDAVGGVLATDRGGVRVDVLDAKASVDRLLVKETTDLIDIVRLMTDGETLAGVREDFGAADRQPVDDVVLHAERQFVDRRARTTRLITAHPTAAIDAGLVEVAATLLMDL